MWPWEPRRRVTPAAQAAWHRLAQCPPPPHPGRWHHGAQLVPEPTVAAGEGACAGVRPSRTGEFSGKDEVLVLPGGPALRCPAPLT